MKITQKICDFLTPFLCCPDTYCDGAVRIHVKSRQDRAEAEFRAYLEVLTHVERLERCTNRLREFAESHSPAFMLEHEVRLIHRRTQQVLESYKAFTAERKRHGRNGD